MPERLDLLACEFRFGTTTVRLREGNILNPGVDVDALVSTDDNYLTMGSGVSRRLAEFGGPEYVRAAQAECPVPAGTVVATASYGLPNHGLTVEHVLHGAVIDYDTHDLPLDQLVYEVTANCLTKAEELGLRSILFPAFATGAGGLPMEVCARRMCGAIKDYLALERRLEEIDVILYVPDDETELIEGKLPQIRNRRFVREANLVLGIPYNPAVKRRQIRDFHGRDAEMQQLQALLAGGQDEKRHAVILGGPRVGKSVLLDELFHRTQQPGSPLSQEQRVARVTFGRLHANTPASFIYRRLLCSLEEVEDDQRVIEGLRQVYADPQLDGTRFQGFLEEHYSQVVFLIDHLPQLLMMGAKEFWSDLDQLGDQVRFVFTARSDHRYQALRELLSDRFKAGLEEIALECIGDAERRAWTDALYEQYVGRGPTDAEHAFIEERGGCHPYLVSLAGYALIAAQKRDALTNPAHPVEYTRHTLAPVFQSARGMIEEAQRDFFDLLMASLDATGRDALRSVAVEVEKRSLLADVQAGRREAATRMATLQADRQLQTFLQDGTLRQLAARGYLVEAGQEHTVEFIAQPFAEYARDFFGLGPRQGDSEVVISLLSPEPQVISTLFRSQGARIVTARKRLLEPVKQSFKRSFSDCLNYLLYPGRHPAPDEFQSPEAVGHFILAQFTTGAIKRYLQNPPDGATIVLAVDDELQDIPWELILETAYSGEIPFRVGRSAVSQRQPSNVKPPVRGDDKIEALLIGDPTDDLDEARIEVEHLAQWLEQAGHFETVVRVGSPETKWLTLLTELQKGSYGLIHYSGHSTFDGHQSAWQLDDGSITTDMLTSALQMGPPALVFSSSCASATGGELQPIKYEDQTFDLPSAFLQAGVEAYIGTLWQVEAQDTRALVEAFYAALLSGEHNLGECLRRAKWACKQRGDRINWPAFILYGDPRLMPGDLFPALQDK